MVNTPMLSRSIFAGALMLVGLLGCSGCSHTPQIEAAPPPRTDAHPLPIVQGKQPLPKLPRLPGDTRPSAP